MPAFNYVHPESLDEALALLADQEHKAIPVAGGSALSRGSRRKADIFVDLRRCGLDRFQQQDDQLVLGASMTCRDILRAGLDGATGQMLNEVADGIATQPLRNVVTIGGNIVNMLSWSDFPVALLALDANISVARHGADNEIWTMARLADEHPLKALPAGALLTQVWVPRYDDGWGANYRRFRQSAVDYSLASVAALVEIKDNKINHISIAVGAVTPRPQRCEQGENLLRGKSASAKNIAAAASAAEQEIRVAANTHMQPETRRRILQVEIRRAIETAVQRAKKNT